MLFVDPSRYARPHLTAPNREFLLRVVPLAGFLQEQTLKKAWVTRKKTVSGVFASLLAAHMIFKSSWGTHPVSVPMFERAPDDRLPGNNLALLEVFPAWKKLTLEYHGNYYRGYKNWREFSIDYSDSLAFLDGYNDVLAEETLAGQVRLMSAREVNPPSYCDNIARLIRDYGLGEFDYYGLKEEGQSC